ncbi:MAG: alpha/beta hydrolase [Pseudomonadales bacterium]|nr:alpha/beta hydrolase [Pseudomonadales bacterium]
MKYFKKIGGFVLTVYLIVGTLLFILQREFMYFPTPKLEHIFEIEQYANDGETIDVVVLNRGNQNAIIYFGGNGERVVNNANDFIDTFQSHTIYLVNYRGYSGSTGTPTEEAIYSDAHAIYDEVGNEHKEISVIGRSLGTGVATFLASTREVTKMVLISPYDSIVNLAQDQYPMYPISLLLVDKYMSSDRVGRIKSKTLILLAENDLVIPFKYSEKIIEEFSPHQVVVETIKNSGHNTISNSNRYYQLLHDFFK